MTRFYDSHCHLDFPAFDADRSEVWSRALQCGVQSVFVPGVRAQQWAALPELRRNLAGVTFGVGLHPYFLHEPSAHLLEESLDSLAQTATELGAVAIGECGLDARVPGRGGFTLEEQGVVLSRQLEVARELRLPVVLHVVDAHGRALELLQRFGPLAAGGAIHAYSGSAELVPRYAALGFSFGFGGALTRPRARRVRLALSEVPLDRLLLETDAPDQAPHGYAGTSVAATGQGAPADPERPHMVRNEPEALALVAMAIGEQLRVDTTQVAQITTNNALALFGAQRAG
jgi:TatD DNase family protein